MKGLSEHPLDGGQLLHGVTWASNSSSSSSPLRCRRLFLKKQQIHLYKRTKRDEITLFTRNLEMLYQINYYLG